MYVCVDGMILDTIVYAFVSKLFLTVLLQESLKSLVIPCHEVMAGLWLRNK